MNEINKEEMFGNVKSFLKSKGIELQDEGAYTQRIRRGCDILTDSVNLSQRGFENARNAMEKGLDQLRQTIHERTAPRNQTPPSQSAAGSGQTAAGAGQSGTKTQTAKAATRATKTTSKKPGRKSAK